MGGSLQKDQWSCRCEHSDMDEALGFELYSVTKSAGLWSASASLIIIMNMTMPAM